MTFQLTPPLWVATEIGGQRDCDISYFNSRHPYGWRPDDQASVNENYDISTHATLMGGDVSANIGSVPIPGFQLTPPLWVATRRGHWHHYWTGISTHATLMGGDAGLQGADRTLRHFNSRHPYGWRRNRISSIFAYIFISTHATLMGGDVDSIRDQQEVIKNFNSRHPYGWRPSSQFPPTV